MGTGEVHTPPTTAVAYEQLPLRKTNKKTVRTVNSLSVGEKKEEEPLGRQNYNPCKQFRRLQGSWGRRCLRYTPHVPGDYM